MGISVVLLAYKEAENLKMLFPRIIAAMDSAGTDYEILLIDSATVLDETPEVCNKYNVRYIPQEEPHYAGAFRTGIRYASKERTVVLDCDGSHDPAVIPAIYKKSLEGYDLVIGSRYCKGGKTNDSKMSQMMSKLLNTVMRIIIGVKARDISTSYRMYMTDQLKAVRLTRINYEVLQEVILKMKLNKPGFRIGEVPIVFEKRVYGESKRQLAKFIVTYIGTLFMLISVRLGLRKDA